jgi:hypothetical protein
MWICDHEFARKHYKGKQKSSQNDLTAECVNFTQVTHDERPLETTDQDFARTTPGDTVPRSEHQKTVPLQQAPG